MAEPRSAPLHLRRFDFQNVGPILRHQHGAVRTGQGVRKIEHTNTVKRLSYETLSHETLSHETLGHETLRITQLLKIAMKSNHPGSEPPLRLDFSRRTILL